MRGLARAVKLAIVKIVYYMGYMEYIAFIFFRKNVCLYVRLCVCLCVIFFPTDISQEPLLVGF